MKKIALLVLFAISAKISRSQIDMISALKTIGENVVYTEYMFVTTNAAGKNDITGKRYVATLKPALNRFGKIVGFDALSVKNPSEKNIEYYYMHGWFDHYTHPSYFIKPDSKNAYAIINGVIIKFEKFQSINSFEITSMWFPKVPKDKSGEALFQGSSMGDFKNANLKQLITDYFTGMQKVQAANPLNETNQTEADAMKFAVDSTLITYKQANDKYWSSEEGQKKLAQMKKPRVILTNDTGADLGICHGQGVSTILKPGERKDFSCNDGKIYKGEVVPNSVNLKRTDKVLLDLNGTNCGAKINASTLLK